MEDVLEELITVFTSLIKIEDWKSLKQEVERLEPYQVTEMLEQLSDRDKIIIFRLLNKEQTKEVFKLLSHEEQQEIIEGLAENATKIAR